MKNDLLNVFNEEIIEDELTLEEIKGGKNDDDKNCNIYLCIYD